MKNIRQIGPFIIFFLLISAFSIEAGENPATIRSQVDKRSIFIGDRIRLSINVSSDCSLELEFPEFTEGKIGSFEIKDAGTRLEKQFFGKHIFSRWYEITSFSVGKSAVPALEVKYRTSPDKDWQILKTDEIAVTVESVIPKTEKAKDIRDIKGPRYFFSINFWVTASLALFLIFSAALIIVYKKIRSRMPVKPANIAAFEELERIRSLFATTGDIREYYFMISDCVRAYIENAFGLRAPEMTTEEFLGSMDGSRSLSDDEKSLLKEFLRTCDMVKFAKHVPSSAEAGSVFDTAKNFISQTGEVMVKREVKKGDARI
jgi:hypothetical protein